MYMYIVYTLQHTCTCIYMHGRHEHDMLKWKSNGLKNYGNYFPELFSPVGSKNSPLDLLNLSIDCQERGVGGMRSASHIYAADCGLLN